MTTKRIAPWKLALGTLLCSGAQVLIAESTNLPPLAVWDTTLQVSEALGYRDNVLFSSVMPESSMFARTAIDASAMRLSETDALFMLFVLGEDTRYLDSVAVEYEQLFSATALWSRPAGEQNEIGLETSYSYQHQIFDASESEVNLRRILVKGHSASATPYWKHEFKKHWSAKLETTAFRQVYEGQLDDYWEGRGKLELAYRYGHRSEAAIRYQQLYRPYDQREQLNQAGFRMTGHNLLYQQEIISAQWRHYWDAKRHWRTTTRLSSMFNRDNGSGYFDYDRHQLKQQLRWKNDRWTAIAHARFGNYRYNVQQVNGEARTRSFTACGLRFERRFAPHGRLFVEGEQEWSTSNDPLDEYNSWMASLGAAYDF